MADKDEPRWGVAQRFEFIEWRLYWVGRLNRGDLEERFKVSTPQASVDLRDYQEAAQGNMAYDQTEKAYLPTVDFTPQFLRLSASRYLAQLNALLNYTIDPPDTWFGSLPSASVMPAVAHSVEPSVLRSILRAIERRYELEIDYQSLSSTKTRAIVPHSLAFDGHRWHARAWCVGHREFRDFVLSRILSVKAVRPSGVDPTDDVEWNTTIQLKIAAHPGLDQSQRTTIEHDYGIKDGILPVPVRLALAFYLIKRLNLDLADKGIEPERLQIFLTNADEVREAQALAKAEVARRTQVISATTAVTGRG